MKAPVNEFESDRRLDYGNPDVLHLTIGMRARVIPRTPSIKLGVGSPIATSLRGKQYEDGTKEEADGSMHRASRETFWIKVIVVPERYHEMSTTEADRCLIAQSYSVLIIDESLDFRIILIIHSSKLGRNNRSGTCTVFLLRMVM